MIESLMGMVQCKLGFLATIPSDATMILLSEPRWLVRQKKKNYA
jgi:hypothetical protein